MPEDPFDKAINRAGAEVAGLTDYRMDGLCPEPSDQEGTQTAGRAASAQVTGHAGKLPTNPIAYASGKSGRSHDACRSQSPDEEVSTAEQFASALYAVTGMLFFGIWVFGHSFTMPSWSRWLCSWQGM